MPKAADRSLVPLPLQPLVVPEVDNLGPKMRELNERQRKFVIAMLETGGGNQAMAARLAGYGSDDPKKEAESGHRLAHNPSILAAMNEEAGNRIKAGAILGASALMEIAKDTQHPQRLKAATLLLGHAGYVVETKHKVVVQDSRSDEEIINRAIAMAKKLGVDPKALLSNYGIVTDAEFTETANLEQSNSSSVTNHTDVIKTEEVDNAVEISLLELGEMGIPL